jgi:hypothetical protein
LSGPTATFTAEVSQHLDDPRDPQLFVFTAEPEVVPGRYMQMVDTRRARKVHCQDVAGSAPLRRSPASIETDWSVAAIAQQQHDLICRDRYEITFIEIEDVITMYQLNPHGSKDGRLAVVRRLAAL